MNIFLQALRTQLETTRHASTPQGYDRAFCVARGMLHGAFALGAIDAAQYSRLTYLALNAASSRYAELCTESQIGGAQ